MITHGSLFSGIGGFDLGFQRAGIETLWDVEIEPYAQAVLRKNFPNTEIFDDVRTVGKHNLKPVSVISGGFPCQDVSAAGKQKGIIEGTRSGLWFEMWRIISELRPEFAVIENVSDLVGLGFERVLCDLAEIGYDAEWQIVSARDLGAPHQRDRVWIVAYPNEMGRKIHRESITWRPLSWDRMEIMARIWDTAIPDLIRIYDGLPDELDANRIAHCGNAIVPQIAELIGNRLVEIINA